MKMFLNKSTVNAHGELEIIRKRLWFNFSRKTIGFRLIELLKINCCLSSTLKCILNVLEIDVNELTEKDLGCQTE